MLQAYTVATTFMLTQRRSLGATSEAVLHTQASEVTRLKKIFSQAEPDRSDVTDLLDAIHRDTTNAFTDEQKYSLVEAASLRLSSTVSGPDGAADVACDLHGTQKSQTHLHSYHYYVDAFWSILMGPLSLQKKFELMSKEWLRWGLRFPSGPSLRVGLATILVATEMTVAPKHAHQLFLDFYEEFKLIRKLTPAPATLKISPAQASVFVMLHPLLAIADVVACQVDAYEIEKYCSKERTPVKMNNKKLNYKQSPTIDDGAAGTPAFGQQMLLALVDQCMGRRSPSTSPPADRRRQLEIEDRRECLETRPAVPAPSTERREGEGRSMKTHASDGAESDRRAAIVDKDVGHVAEPVSDESKGAIRAHLDDLDGQINAYMAGKKVLQKPSAAKKVVKKAAAIGEEEEEDEASSDEEEDDKAPVVKSPCKPKTKAEAKAKAATKKVAAKKVKAEATPAVLKRPASVDKGPPAKFPRLNEDETVYYGVGRLYKADGGIARAYPRKGDRKDKRFSFANKKHSWKRGIKLVVRSSTTLAPCLSSIIEQRRSVDRRCSFSHSDKSCPHSILDSWYTIVTIERAI